MLDTRCPARYIPLNEREGMMRTLLSLTLACGLGAVAPALAAEPSVLTGAEARDLMFRENGRTVEIAEVDFLGAPERRALEAYGEDFAYYGAMAASPGDRVDSGSAVALANYHSPEAAATAALEGCEARRQEGGPCIIVATINPRRFEARDLTLSVEATSALRGEYRRLEAPKAFAISPSTGAWAMARGDGTRALDQCAARAGAARDCRIVVADR